MLQKGLQRLYMRILISGKNTEMLSLAWMQKRFLYGMTIARHWKLTGMLLNGNILTQTQKNISNSIPDFFKKKEKIIRYTR